MMENLNQRFKNLEKSTGLTIEELLGIAANYYVDDCLHCVLKEVCSASAITCRQAWTDYLKGAKDGEA